MLDFLWQQRGPLALAVALVFAAVLVVQWFCWIFQIGRFANRAVQQTSNQLLYVTANFFVEIINDFRHLLALVIVVLFAVALFLAMYPGLRGRDVNTIKEGVQAVAAALGGLIGSIIGYYFGESAATRRDSPGDTVRDSSVPVQAAPTAAPAADIMPAPRPPQ